MKRFETEYFVFALGENFATLSYSILTHSTGEENIFCCVDSCVVENDTVARRVFKIAIQAYFAEGWDEDVFPYAVQYARMKKWQCLDDFLHDYWRFYQVE